MRSRAGKRKRRAIGRHQRRPGAPRSSERWAAGSGRSESPRYGGGRMTDALVRRREDDKNRSDGREGRPRANGATKERLFHRLLVTILIGCHLFLFSGVIAQDLVLSPLQLNAVNSWQESWTQNTNSSLIAIQVSPSSVRPFKINYSRHFPIYPILGFKDFLVLLNYSLTQMNSTVPDNSVFVSPSSVRPIHIETLTANALEENLEKELISSLVSNDASPTTSSIKRKRENSLQELKAAFPKIINVGLHINPQNHRPALKEAQLKEKKWFGPKAFLWDYLHRVIPSSTHVQEKDKVQVSPSNLRPLQLQPLHNVEDLWNTSEQSRDYKLKSTSFKLASKGEHVTKQQKQQTQEDLDTTYFDTVPFDQQQDSSEKQNKEQLPVGTENINPSPTWKTIQGLPNDVTSSENEHFPPYPIAATAASFSKVGTEYIIPQTNDSLLLLSEMAVEDRVTPQPSAWRPESNAENEATHGGYLQIPIPIRIQSSTKKDSQEDSAPSLSADLMSLILEQSNNTLSSEEQQVFDDIFPSENRTQEFPGDALSIPSEVLLAFGEDLDEGNGTTSLSDNEVTPSSDDASKWTLSQVDPTGRGVRSRRDVLLLYNLVSCATGCNPMKYISYGCYCGFMGAGVPVDGIDRCCMMHDWCYDHLPCPQHMLYFIPYKWTCQLGRAQCHGRNANWNHPSNCAFRMCECDRVFSECLRNQPCPKRKALCRSSAWRFLKNLLLGLGVVG